jgi:hypothetical protein
LGKSASKAACANQSRDRYGSPNRGEASGDQTGPWRAEEPNGDLDESLFEGERTELAELAGGLIFLYFIFFF